MKKFLIITLFTLFMSASFTFAQNEIRHLPYFLDMKWSDVPLEQVRSAHLDPRFAPKSEGKYVPAPPRIQSESGIELINISQVDQNQAETFIIVNPHNPNNIIAASNDYRYINSRMTAFYSHDGGQTWDVSLLPNNRTLPFIDRGSDGTTNVDPGLGFDSEGNLYYVYLYAVLNDADNGDSGIFVAKSTDGGKTWLSDPDDIGVPVINFEGHLQDKCFIGVDSDPNSPYKNRVYVAWFNTAPPYSIGFSYAEDGINFNVGVNSINGSVAKSIQSPLPVVGPDGVLYVTWREGLQSGAKTQAVVNKSTNGGQSWLWTIPKTAQMVNTSGEVIGNRRALADKDGMRVSSFPSMDVDLRNGNLYLVQSGRDDNNKYGVFLSKSTDGGETWSGSGGLSDLKKIDGNTHGNDVFMPAITVDPVTGMIAVLYYSSENDPENNTGCDAFVAISFDEGETFKHIQLTDTWYFRSNSAAYAGSENLGRYWGDYTSIDAYNGKIYPCFWMPTAANAYFNSCDLFTAILSTVPEMPVDLALEVNWEEPSQVTVVWKDPTSNELGGELTDFQIHIYKDGNKIGEVNEGVQQFTYDGLTPGENFTLNLRTYVVATGEQSGFVSISGVAGGSLEPKMPTAITPRPNENGILLFWTNPVEHVDNSYLFDLDAVEVYVDDELVETVSSPSIQAGEMSSVQLNLPTKAFYKIQMKAKTKRGEYTGESSFSNEIIAYAGSPLTVLDESFDDDGNVTAFYTNMDWAVTSEESHSAPNCITDSPNGEKYPILSSALILAPVVIQENQATLQIAHIALISVKNYGTIKVSNDFGNTYTEEKWLDVRRYEGWDQSYQVDQSEWFVDGILDLSKYSGDTIFIMFEIFAENGLNRKDGWYIDDIKIGNFPVGVEYLSNPRDKYDMKISPNPAKDEAKFEFTLSSGNNILIALYDDLGKLVANVEDAGLNPGNHEYTLNTSGLSNGAYYLRLSIEGYSEVLPLIIQK